jgi:hypothetical protein
MERFLQFVMSHNATIIEILFGLTLLGVSFLAVRSFLLAKEPSSGGASLDMGNLETMLQQILEKAGQVPSVAGSGGGGSTEDSQRLLTEITNLKTDLETKKKQIDEMKTAAASAPAPAAAGGLSAEEKAALDDKIRELQAKLSEYEIISEDIADLSFYKEQNAKLQKELDGLKAGGATAAAPAAPVPTPAPAAAAPPPPPPPPPPKEEPAIVGKATAPEAPPPSPAEPAATSSAPELAIDDDLMAEFAAAVEKQKSTDGAPAPAAAAPAASAAPASAAPAGADDSLGKMDMDKMLAEAAEIKNDGPDVSAEAALGTSLDENKLLQEAAALGSVSAEDKKLMGDFENFVKKGE